MPRVVAVVVVGVVATLALAVASADAQFSLPFATWLTVRSCSKPGCNEDDCGSKGDARADGTCSSDPHSSTNLAVNFDDDDTIGSYYLQCADAACEDGPTNNCALQGPAGASSSGTPGVVCLQNNEVSWKFEAIADRLYQDIVVERFDTASCGTGESRGSQTQRSGVCVESTVEAGKFQKITLGEYKTEYKLDCTSSSCDTGCIVDTVDEHPEQSQTVRTAPCLGTSFGIRVSATPLPTCNQTADPPITENCQCPVTKKLGPGGCNSAPRAHGVLSLSLFFFASLLSLLF